MSIRKIILTMIGLLIVPAFVAAQDANLAEKARAILKTHCYRCHGENGSVEGGVNYLLDRHQLVGRGKVTPKEPVKSRIIKRILLEEMPPDGEKNRPSAAELAILKEWIAAGAPDFNPPLAKRAFIQHAATLATLKNDLAKLSEQDQRFARYFTFTHLYNANLSNDELTTYRHALSKLINSLSWGKRIVPPAAVDAEKTIYRIDLRDYKWSAKTWDALEAHYPYGLLVSSKDETACQQGTGTRLPALRGDWFVASAALPPLYHDLLGMPMTDRALEKELRVSALENLRDGEAMRAGFNSSGVSRNNRLIERHASLFGAYWKSYDFASNTQRQNLFALPLGPGVRVTHFKHDGGEIIFSLPNGLQGYMLVDAHGTRIDKGPTEIVSDPRRPDRTVVNGLSCMSCHSRGIITKDDQVRPHVEKNRQAFLKDELQQILALYPSRQRMQKVMEEDAARFREAVEKTGCQVGATEPIAALTQRFESEIDLIHAAAELGMPAAQLQKSFEKSVTLGRLMGPLAIEGGTVQRDVFTEAYASAVQDLALGKAAPALRGNSFWWTAPARSSNWTPPPKVTLPIVTPPVTVVKPKAPRKFVATPSSHYEDPWYFRVSAHPTGQIHAVALSPKDKRIAAFEATTGVITLFHRGHFDNWSSMTGHKGNILALDFSPSGALLASGSIDQTAKIWDADTGEERHTLGGHSGFVRAVRFSPDGQWLATGSERVRLWNVATGSEKGAFANTPTWIESLAFAPDGQTIATASKSLQLWETATGKLLHDFNEHVGAALSVAFSPDGKLLAFGTSEGLIYLLDRDTNQPRAILKGHRQPVGSLAFNRTSRLLVSAGKPSAPKEEGEFKGWDPATGKEICTQTGHKAGIAGLAISADGHVAVTAGLDGYLRFRDLMYLRKVPLGPFEGHFMTHTSAAFSGDGNVAATCGSDRTVRIWDAKTGAPKLKLEGHLLPVHEVCLSHDGKFAFSGGADKNLCKWDLSARKLALRLTFGGSIMEITQSADSTTLGVLINRDFVHVMDAATGKTIRDIKGPERNVVLSPDGKRLAGAVSPKGMRVWDVATGNEIATIDTAQSVISSACFSPDGKRILTGARDNSVYLWDAETGKEIVRFKGCTKEVHSVAFADGGAKILASCGAYKTPIVDNRREYVGCAVLMWDATGKELHRWNTNPNIVRRVAVSPTEPAALFVHIDGVKRVAIP